jgi:hypothetical protein
MYGGGFRRIVECVLVGGRGATLAIGLCVFHGFHETLFPICFLVCKEWEQRKRPTSQEKPNPTNVCVWKELTLDM